MGWRPGGVSTPGDYWGDGVGGPGAPPLATWGTSRPEITGQAQQQLPKAHSVNLRGSGTWGRCPEMAQETRAEEELSDSKTQRRFHTLGEMWLSGAVTGTKVCCFCKPTWRVRSRSPKTTLATCGKATVAGYTGNTILEAWNAACRTDRQGRADERQRVRLTLRHHWDRPRGAWLWRWSRCEGTAGSFCLALSVLPGGDAVGSPASFLALDLGGFGVARAFPPAQRRVKLM